MSLYDCCKANCWGPWTSRLFADGITLAINGQRRSDVRKLPTPDGSAIGGMIETWLPIVDWSDDDVFAFLDDRGISRVRYYDPKPQGPECATCPAGWGEGRAAYLRPPPYRGWHPLSARM